MGGPDDRRGPAPRRAPRGGSPGRSPSSSTGRCRTSPASSSRDSTSCATWPSAASGSSAGWGWACRSCRSTRSPAAPRSTRGSWASTHGGRSGRSRPMQPRRSGCTGRSGRSGRARGGSRGRPRRSGRRTRCPAHAERRHPGRPAGVRADGLLAGVASQPAKRRRSPSRRPREVLGVEPEDPVALGMVPTRIIGCGPRKPGRSRWRIAHRRRGSMRIAVRAPGGRAATLARSSVSRPGTSARAAVSSPASLSQRGDLRGLVAFEVSLAAPPAARRSPPCPPSSSARSRGSGSASRAPLSSRPRPDHVVGSTSMSWCWSATDRMRSARPARNPDACGPRMVLPPLNATRSAPASMNRRRFVRGGGSSTHRRGPAGRGDGPSRSKSVTGSPRCSSSALEERPGDRLVDRRLQLVGGRAGRPADLDEPSAGRAYEWS